MTPESPLSPSVKGQLGTLPQSPSQAAAAAQLSAGEPRLPRVPGYEVVGELGRGGMGIVYKAEQTALGRTVALKMIRFGQAASEEDLARFRREAEAVARLQHPNVIQIHEIGQVDGTPYFSLEYCPGGSLDRRLNGTPLPPREAADLARTLAHAVHAAHEKGIVHRDLKPANVLLAPDGTPKVTDFGLAKRLDDVGHTPSGAVLGTPSYMAPEQAGGMVRQVSAAVDIYALGALLYECLTGRPPFRGATPLDTVVQVMTLEPVAPRQLQPGCPRDLETVCLKCLRKEPRNRYRSAREVADDLGRFLGGEPIHARPVGPVERSFKWVKRRPFAAALLAVSAAAVAALAVAFVLVVQEQRRTHREQQQRVQAQVGALLDATSQAAGALLDALEPYREEVVPRLRQVLDDPAASEQHRTRASLGLLAGDPEQLPYLHDRLLSTDLDPDEFLLVRDRLAPHREALVGDLWAEVDRLGGADARRFRALVALAAFDAESPRWPAVAESMVEPLANVEPLHLGSWARGLRPVRSALVGPLMKRYQATNRREERRILVGMLLDYAGKQVDVLTALLLDADERSFAMVLPFVKDPDGPAVALLQQQVELPSPSHDQPLARPTAESDADLKAQRQANAGLALLRLRPSAEAWAMWRHRPDPRARTYLIHRAALFGVPARHLAERLDVESDASARRALILCLGTYRTEELPADLVESLTSKLLAWYADDPDAGVHGAIDWLLRHGTDGPAARPHDWRHAAALQQIDRQLTGTPPPPSRQWSVNGQGQTFTHIRGPVDFWMGSPENEEGRRTDETLHVVRIPRGYAVATKPVTVREFRKFTMNQPAVKHYYTKDISPVDDGPIISVTWYEGAAYCRWLSEQEGIDEPNMCYPPVADIMKAAADAKPLWMPTDYLSRTGYRLPTEAEWEYSCRAGTVTSRYYGSSDELLPAYSWYQGNLAHRTWPVGQKLPNDFGLFDMQGNVSQWCQEYKQPYCRGTPERPVIDGEDPTEISDKFSRVFRGGSIYTSSQGTRSSYRFWARPSDRNVVHGLRVVRTLP